MTSMRSAGLLLLLLVGCSSVESVSVPGTSIRFDLVRVSGWGRTPGFWIGAREVTWAKREK